MDVEVEQDHCVECDGTGNQFGDFACEACSGTGFQQVIRLPPHDKVSLLLGIAKLRDFVRDLLDMSNYDDIDGGDFQDLCVKYGILVPTLVKEPCDSEYCACAEFDPDGFPMTCFRRARWFKPKIST